MMKIRFLRLLFLVFCVQPNLSAKMIFGSSNSAFKLGNGSTFVLSQNMTDYNGTFYQASSAQLLSPTGKTISFAQGGTSKATDLSTYTVNMGTGAVSLAGGDVIQAKDEITINSLSVGGVGNAIFGQVLLNNPIVFDGDPNTTLTVGLLNQISKDIQLNGGKLVASDDIALGSGVKITGGGTVKLKDKSLSFGNAPLSLTSRIYWDGAKDIQLNSKLNLSSVWTFSDVCVLNGNGNILDLSGSGTLLVEDGATLYLTDVVVKGIGAGGVRCLGNASKIVLSNAQLGLTQNYTFTLGNIYVEGPTTFALGNKNWLFSQQGTLSVDGVVLWMERLDSSTLSRGTISFGAPTSNYLTLLNSGTIQDAPYLGDAGTNGGGGGSYVLPDWVQATSNSVNALAPLVVANSNAINGLVNRVGAVEVALTSTYNYLLAQIAGVGGSSPIVLEPLTTSTIVDRSANINTNEKITIAADLTIDGKGSILTFVNNGISQFVVQEGRTLTLENINLYNVNAHTFGLGPTSRVIIGDNVTFAMGENVLFNQGQFWIAQGKTMTMRGMNGTKRITLAGSFLKPADPALRRERRAFEPEKIFAIDSGATLVLQDVEFSEASQIDCAATGAVKLAGRSTMMVNNNTDLNIVVEDLGNELRLLQDNLILNGNLVYSNTMYNELNVTHQVTGTALAKPRVTFGPTFELVASALGKAALNFENPWITVYNEGQNSFILSNNAILSGRTVEILHNPIRRIATSVEVDPSLTLTTDLPSPIVDSSLAYVPPVTPRSISATDFARVARSHKLNKIDKKKEQQLETTFRSPWDDETLRVAGKQVITVSRASEVDSPIVFEPKGHLIFSFDPQTTDPLLLFSSLASVAFAPSTCLEFQGTGTVLWDNNCVVTLPEGEAPNIVCPPSIGFVFVTTEKPVA